MRRKHIYPAIVQNAHVIVAVVVCGRMDFCPFASILLSVVYRTACRLPHVLR